MSNPLLGLDIGLKRTGVALSPNGLDVQPLPTISWDPPHAHGLIQRVSELVKEHGITTLVIGVPLSEDASQTSQSERASRVQNLLVRELSTTYPDLNVAFTNEFASTQDGRATFPGLDKDAAAACTILRDYLEQHE
jgi:putative transcription antitermination factor YqgF